MGSQGVIRYIEKIVRLASSRLFLAQSQTKHVLYSVANEALCQRVAGVKSNHYPYLWTGR